MAEAHPTELRDRVVRAYEAGEGGYAAMAFMHLLSAEAKSPIAGQLDRPSEAN